jgi:Asp-tRNA(Asn)/Glu-tRNA(Gln) amidotransferase A subunit family amidase
MARHYGPYHDRGADALSPWMRTAIEEGRTITAVDYLAGLDRRDLIHAGVVSALGDGDVFLTPAAPGAAPAGIDATGSPAFNTLWTLCGMPAISLPLLAGAKGLPLGVQLVARRGEDARLMRAAAWLMAAGIAG